MLTTAKSAKDNQKPYCMQVLNPHMPYGLNELTLKILALKLPNVPEKDLAEMLQLICGSSKSGMRELGPKISKALSAVSLQLNYFNCLTKTPQH